MQCPDFERLWNERLDARRAGEADELGRELDAHAAGCDSCRAIARRFRTLQQALHAWGPPPSVSPDFADRVLESHRAEPAPFLRFDRRARWLVPLATAASLLVAAAVAVRFGPEMPPGRGASDPRVAGVDDAGSLTEALARARSATWELARETSGPAARIGRQVLDSATIAPEAPLPFTVTAAPATEVLQSVGDRVQKGVVPLSGSARHAFGFLLGGSPAAAPTAAPPT